MKIIINKYEKCMNSQFVADPDLFLLICMMDDL